VKVVYVVIVDIEYAVRGLALYRSLVDHLQNSEIGFYCVDEDAATLFEEMALPGSYVVRRPEFETPDLAALWSTRARNEWCWTAKAALILHAFRNRRDTEWGVYLDSDMAAFGEPHIGLLSAGEEAEVVLTPHRFSAPYFAAFEEAVGRYNAGYAAFKNSETGHAALDWWLARCIENCPNIPNDNAYADQKYLAEIGDCFPGVSASPHCGLNAAPWNVFGKHITGTAEQPEIDGEPLLLFHFQGLRIHGTRLYDMYPDQVRLPADLIELVYRPYARRLHDAFAEIRRLRPRFRNGIRRPRPRWLLTQSVRVLRGHCNLVLAR